MIRPSAKTTISVQLDHTVFAVTRWDPLLFVENQNVSCLVLNGVYFNGSYENKLEVYFLKSCNSEFHGYTSILSDWSSPQNPLPPPSSQCTLHGNISDVPSFSLLLSDTFLTGKTQLRGLHSHYKAREVINYLKIASAFIYPVSTKQLCTKAMGELGRARADGECRQHVWGTECGRDFQCGEYNPAFWLVGVLRSQNAPFGSLIAGSLSWNFGPVYEGIM